MPLILYFTSQIVIIHYAVRIFIGTAILWLMLHNEQTTNSLWAIISLITVTEPQIRPAWIATRHLVTNTLIGCAAALFFLLLAGVNSWVLPPALAASALVSALANRMEQGWKTAPTTSAIVLSAAMTQKATEAAMAVALHRTTEVIIGGITALIVTRVVAVIWLPHEVTQTPEAIK